MHLATHEIAHLKISDFTECKVFLDLFKKKKKKWGKIWIQESWVQILI